MLSGFTFNRIVIVQSLEPREVSTGVLLSDFISRHSEIVNANLPIEVINCGYAGEFLQIVNRLQAEAASGNIPLLHVECHGDSHAGLEFENGSTLAWERVSEALRPLNIASRFNLLAVFSACFGAHFLGQMGVIEPAPCWCIVAPTEEVDPGEILAGFREFYTALLNDGDMGSAIKAIARCPLSKGVWLCQLAETWFEELVTGYVKVHCTEAAARARARVLHRKLKSEGQNKSVGSLLRILRVRNRESLLGEYFDKYFTTREVPENIQRFDNVKQRVKAELAALRSTGRYVI